MIPSQYRTALTRTVWAVCIGTIALLHAATSHGESLRARIHEGNALYQQSLYDEALEMYNDAQIDAPESPELHFNIGNVNYRKEDHENAIETYLKSFNTDDIRLESKADYNIGNAKYRLGEKTGNIALWREAMEFYRRAIELDADDEDAKYNLEFVEKKIKEALSKQQDEQEKPEQEQQQERRQEKQERSEENGSPKPESEEQTTEEEREEKQEEREGKQEESGAAEQPQQQLELEQVAQPAEEADNLAEQEIFSILQAEEKAAREQALSRMARYPQRVVKDW